MRFSLTTWNINSVRLRIDIVAKFLKSTRPDVLCPSDFGAVLTAQGQCVEGHRAIHMQIADLDVGILYLFAVAGTGVVGAAIAGYASNNKYSLLGGLRAASQMVSYEVTMGLAIVGCLMVYGTVQLDDIVRWQDGPGRLVGRLPAPAVVDAPAE